MQSVTQFRNIFSFLFFITFIACKKKDIPAPPPQPAPSSNKVITVFNFTLANNPTYLISDVIGTIATDTIQLIVPAETDITSLNPAISYTGKSISPSNGIVQNFSAPVNYIVTAEDGSTKKYTISVKYRSTVFVSCLNGVMYALDGNTGLEIWKLSNGKFHSGSPSVYNGMVYICGIDGLYGLDAKTGLQKWKLPVATLFSTFDFLPSPVAVNNTVYISMWDGFVYALNAADGNLKWKTQSTFGKAFSSNVTINNNLLYTGCVDSSLYAINIATGAINWKFKTKGPIYQNPLVVNNNVFTGGSGDNQYLLNGLNGTVIWSTFNDTQSSSATYDNGIIYTGGGARGAGYNVLSGNQEWSFFIPGNLIYSEKSSAIVLNGVFYAGSANGKIYAHNINSRNPIWSVTTNGGAPYVYSSPVIANGILYIGGVAEDIYAIDAASGNIVWDKKSAPAIGSACVVDQSGIKHYSGISGEQN
jgi:eukaryotic-like serine/threonine-protein kinase